MVRFRLFGCPTLDDEARRLDELSLEAWSDAYMHTAPVTRITPITLVTPVALRSDE